MIDNRNQVRKTIALKQVLCYNILDTFYATKARLCASLGLMTLEDENVNLIQQIMEVIDR